MNRGNTKVFPPINPFHTFRFKVSEIHELYVERCGNPNGKPVVFLHGGPGGGLDPLYRQFFDPEFYHIILFDQRGCGQSTPFAELRENTTWDLVSDIEKIRTHLGLQKWLVFGGSWGSTLALSYAVTHPEKVTGLILRGIFLCSHEELQWFYQEGASWIFPDFWEKYKNHIPIEERGNYIKAYYNRLTSENEDTRLLAAQIWSTWEAATSKLIPNTKFISEYEDPKKALPFARIEAHYFINNAFFNSPNFLIEESRKKLQNISCRIIHGRYDVVCPLKNAWDLHQALPKSELRIVQQSGHSALEEGITKELLQATEDFKYLLKVP